MNYKRIVKLHKKGKQWLAIAVFIGIAGGVTFVGGQSASADKQPGTANDTENQMASTSGTGNKVVLKAPTVDRSATVGPKDNDAQKQPNSPTENTNAPEPKREPKSDGTVETQSLQQMPQDISLLANKTSDSLTDPITGSDIFNLPSNTKTQPTFGPYPTRQHLAQTKGAWQSQAFADAIPMDAAGIDPKTGQHYLDEWMPDTAFQVVLWETAYSNDAKKATKRFNTFIDFYDQFTKNDLSSLTKFETLDNNTGGHDRYSNEQGTVVGGVFQPTNYFKALVTMNSLEGLQYATNLTDLDIELNLQVNADVFAGNAVHNAYLFDINALTNLKKLQTLRIEPFAIHDITPLANHSELSSVSMWYNQITDLSPLATDPKLGDLSTSGFQYQHVYLSPIYLDPKATTLTTPSFIVKNLHSANLPVTGFSGDPVGTTYPVGYPSTADGGNINPNTLSWANFKQNPADKFGILSAVWGNSNTNFSGWFIQPYVADANISIVQLNFQVLQENLEQVQVAPTVVIPANDGTQAHLSDLLNFPAAGNTIQDLLQRGYVPMFVLSGTGKYVDAIRGDGSAKQLVMDTLVPFNQKSQILTMVLTKPFALNVSYRLMNSDGTVNTDPSATEKLPANWSYAGVTAVSPIPVTAGTLCTAIDPHTQQKVEAGTVRPVITGLGVQSLEYSTDNGTTWQLVPGDSKFAPKTDSDILLRVNYTSAVVKNTIYDIRDEQGNLKPFDTTAEVIDLSGNTLAFTSKYGQTYHDGTGREYQLKAAQYLVSDGTPMTVPLTGSSITIPDVSGGNAYKVHFIYEYVDHSAVLINIDGPEGHVLTTITGNIGSTSKPGDAYNVSDQVPVSYTDPATGKVYVPIKNADGSYRLTSNSAQLKGNLTGDQLVVNVLFEIQGINNGGGGTTNPILPEKPVVPNKPTKPVKPIKPVKPMKPQKPTNGHHGIKHPGHVGSGLTGQNMSHVRNNTNMVLPQTNQQNGWWAAAIGLFGLIGTLGAFSGKNKH